MSSTFADNGAAAVRWLGTSSGVFNQSIGQDLLGVAQVVDAGASITMACSNHPTPTGGGSWTMTDHKNWTVNLFENAAADDYRLSSSSPSLNTCAAGVGVYANNRPDFFLNLALGAFDQGCHERQ